MSGFYAISAVSQALEQLLTNALRKAGLTAIEARRHMLQPPPTANQPLLTIFLYDVGEDATVRNSAPRQVVVNGVQALKRAPVPLILRYMVTPWSNDPVDADRMLGCTIGALHDSRTVLGRDLRALLANGNPATDSIDDIELVSLNMAQLTLEEKSKIWWAIQQPFHLSLMYELRVLGIDVLSPAGAVAGQVSQRALAARLPEAAP